MLIKPKAKASRECFAWALYLANQYSGSLHILQSIKDEASIQSCPNSIYRRLAEIECCIHMLRKTDAKILLSKLIDEITKLYSIDNSVQQYSIELCKRYADQLNSHFPILSVDQDGCATERGNRDDAVQKSTAHEMLLSPLPCLKRGRQLHQRDSTKQLSFDMGQSSLSKCRPSPHRAPLHDLVDPLKASIGARHKATTEHNRCSSYDNIHHQNHFNFKVVTRITAEDSSTEHARFYLPQDNKTAKNSEKSILNVDMQANEIVPEDDVDFSKPITTSDEVGANNSHTVHKRIDEESSKGSKVSSHLEADATVAKKDPMSKTDSRKKHNRTRKIASNNENLYLSTSAKVSESSEETQSETKFQQVPKKPLPMNPQEDYLSTNLRRESSVHQEKEVHLSRARNSTHNTQHTKADCTTLMLNVVDIATPPEGKEEIPVKQYSKEWKQLQTTRETTSTKSFTQSMSVLNPNESEMKNQKYDTTEKVAFLRVTDRLPGAIPDVVPPDDTTPNFSDDFPDGECTAHIEFPARNHELSPTLSSVNTFYKHEQLIAPGPYPAGICIRKREIYLGEEEFKRVLGVSRSAWDSLPKWKQEQRKRAAKLF